jgi:hypothetical protein
MTIRSDCATMEEWISESLDAALPEDRRAALVLHLQDCGSCTAFLADLEGMNLELRSASAPPAELRRVWSRLAPALPRRPGRSRWIQVAAVFLLAALSYAAGRRSAPAEQTPQVVGPVAPVAPKAAEPPAPRVLSDISARMSIAALFPGAGDPGSVLLEETKRLAVPELTPSPH